MRPLSLQILALLEHNQKAMRAADIADNLDADHTSVLHCLARLKKYKQVESTVDTEHIPTSIRKLTGERATIPIRTKYWIVSSYGTARIDNRGGHKAYCTKCDPTLRSKEWEPINIAGLQVEIKALKASSSTISPIEYVNAVDDVLKGPIGLQRIIDITDVDDLPSGISWIVQKKYDGWLVQYLNNQLYTRHGMNITKQFIPILSAFQKLKGVHLIGELVFFANDNKQDKQMVGKVAMMKNIQGANKIIDEASGTYKIVLFDIIGYDGDDISDLPYKERLKILRNAIMPSKHILIVKDYPFIKENDAYQESLNEGGEGVVYKHPGQIFFWANLPKEPRPVNNQYKRKKHLTDDFIIFKYDYTDKGTLRIHFGQLWKKEIIEVGTLGITKHEKKTEILNLLKHGPFVAEFKYTERYKDPPGALRDPVYLFPRLDKPIESVLLPYEYGS